MACCYKLGITFQWTLIEGGWVDVSGNVEDGESGTADAAVGEEGDRDGVRRSDRERWNRHVILACGRIETVDSNRTQSLKNYNILL